MSRAVPIGVAGAVAILAALAVGLLTRVPYRVGDRDLAAVRLTWRMVGKAVEDCRTLSEDELAKLPVHMRQPRVCETRVPPYRLRVRIDGEMIEDILVLAGGARASEPIYVYSELRVAPGSHDLWVEFEQEAEGGEAAEPADGDNLELRETIELSAGQVALVTFDREARRLVLR